MGSRVLSSVARRLEGKVALITGGASGIGERTARLFSHHGAKVVIADVQHDLGLLVCKELGPQSTSFIHCDVTNEPDVKNTVDTAVTKHGKLDIMVNNAGIIEPTSKPSILDNDKAEFERVLAVNVTGVFLGTKHSARAMIPARQGSIISTASVCSVMGGIASHSYTCSKHAVAGLTKNAAVELGRFGIRVNCVSPYVVGTALAKKFFDFDDGKAAGFYTNILDGRELKGEDIAEAALYLASEESRYVSGHNLVVDGGFTTGTSFKWA